MFAAEVFMHRFLLKSEVRTLNPEEADWFFVPVYTTCDLTPNGLPLPFKSPRMMRSAIQLVATKWPYWNRTEGADHFFVTPHDFGACFHYQVISLILVHVGNECWHGEVLDLNTGITV
jgi:putative beta-1,4-xylosyltransferase IRX10